MIRQRPNLFHFATSELSQDAILCWIAACADSSIAETELRTVGIDFLRLLASKAGALLPNVIESVRIMRQQMSIDITIEVNNDLVFIIEDKSGTSHHSDQLKRYLMSARNFYKDRTVVPIYLQTFIEPNYNEIVDAGFLFVGRAELIDLIPASISDSLLSQFREHLLEIDNKYESFRTTKEWDSFHWQAYFEKITSLIEGCEWRYFPNAQGGFYSAFWGWTRLELGELYLQLGEKRLSVRICPDKGVSQDDIYALYQKGLAFSGWEVAKKAKPRKGKTINLINLEMDHRKFDADGMISIDETVASLKAQTEKMRQFVKTL